MYKYNYLSGSWNYVGSDSDACPACTAVFSLVPVSGGGDYYTYGSHVFAWAQHTPNPAYVASIGFFYV